MIAPGMLKWDLSEETAGIKTIHANDHEIIGFDLAYMTRYQSGGCDIIAKRYRKS